MKHSILFTMTCIALFATDLQPAHAQKRNAKPPIARADGNGGSKGGDERDDFAEALRQRVHEEEAGQQSELKRLALDYLIRRRYQIIGDETARVKIERMVADGAIPLLRDRIRLRADDVCSAKAVGKNEFATVGASTSSEKGSPICLNIARATQNHFPSLDAAFDALLSLVLHELTHQHQEDQPAFEEQNEKEAQIVGGAVLNSLMPASQPSMPLSISGNCGRGLRWLIDEGYEDGFAKQGCVDGNDAWVGRVEIIRQIEGESVQETNRTERVYRNETRSQELSRKRKTFNVVGFEFYRNHKLHGATRTHEGWEGTYVDGVQVGLWKQYSLDRTRTLLGTELYDSAGNILAKTTVSGKFTAKAEQIIPDPRQAGETGTETLTYSEETGSLLERNITWQFDKKSIDRTYDAKTRRLFFECERTDRATFIRLFDSRTGSRGSLLIQIQRHFGRNGGSDSYSLELYSPVSGLLLASVQDAVDIIRNSLDRAKRAAKGYGQSDQDAGELFAHALYLRGEREPSNIWNIARDMSDKCSERYMSTGYHTLAMQYTPAMIDYLESVSQTLSGLSPPREPSH